MKYYDGPAFFRRRDLIKSRTPKKGKNKYQSAPDYSRKPTRDLKKEDTHFTDNRVSDDTTPAFLKEIRNFVPNQRDVNAKRRKQKKQIETNYFVSQKNRRSTYYSKLMDQLRTFDDDLIVLEDPLNSVTQSEKGTLKKTDDHILEHHNITPNTEQLEAPLSDSDLNHNTDTDRVNQTDEGDLKENVGNHEKDDLENELNHHVIDSSKSTNSRPEVSHPIKHGLGQSLVSIVDSERAAKPDLSLFHEQTKDGLSDTKEISAKDDQKRQPVVEKLAVETSGLPTETATIQSQSSTSTDGYHFPSLGLLKKPQPTDENAMDDWIENQIETLDKTFHAFKVNAQVVDWTDGPTVTQFQVKLALGVKVSRITNLTDDLKLALAAKDIRIEAPIPGKSTVGIEIPNPNPRPVVLSEIISTSNFTNSRSPLTTAMGVDLSGTPRIADVRKMPHGLIAGATGSGKSVFINSLLVSLLYKATPAELKLLLIDPKAVELAPYDGIPHLLSPVISDPKSAAAALHWVTKEMDQRYEKLSAASVRNIEQFNKKASDAKEYGLKMPYILVIIDELADLMMAASSEVEDYIVRITQKARAAGIHLIVATQRPSVDIVTGTIKNNIPSRIAFMVSSQVDSRTILDTAGAERLLGRGDMLYLGNGASQPIRLQGAFVNNKELENVVDFVRQQGQPHYLFTPDSLKAAVDNNESQDDLMPQIMKFIAQEDTISTSKLQRVFSIGYNRAANIIDSLQDRNLISEQRGSKPRTVYYHPDDETSDESKDEKE